MVSGLINENPIVYQKQERRARPQSSNTDELSAEAIDQLEIFDILFLLHFLCFFLTVTEPNCKHFKQVFFGDAIIKLLGSEIWFQSKQLDIPHIKDPEHPYSLEELKVLTEDSVEVDDDKSYVRVTFTPTVEHCSMVAIIGLCIRVKLMRSLPDRYKVDIRIAPGTHATEDAVNKQLNDKERVAAALESPNLVEMVDECLLPSFE
ncbi:unnamed protein product [Arabis nemorensis]|uniref:Uncharacterized protein n=1 Tax=Arabis nemorensis TaxID=586526 RepID=A0A565AZI3_9BRAS|nr:unnamed protein product [Arabis nemorensis]